MTTGVAILGSTGSIGTSTLRVVARQHDRFKVIALTALDSGDLLAKQAKETGAVFTGLVNGSPNGKRRNGAQCLIEAATHPDVKIVVNAIVGAAGLAATLAALRAGKRVALANKETLVMAGDLVLQAAREGGGEIVPVDSEHSAVLQCISGRPRADLKRLILTASGGPFREWTPERLATATVVDALRHPTWQMGKKITVDSATLANKALEVIEAHHLFGLGYEAIEVVVHPQSIIHAFAEFVDGSMLAQVGFPNMELPILYALTHPGRVSDQGVPRYDPVGSGALTFEAIRHDLFPAFRLGVAAGRQGGTAPAAFNAANEVAVDAFLKGALPFAGIPRVIERVLEACPSRPLADVATVLEADRIARTAAQAQCS